MAPEQGIRPRPHTKRPIVPAIPLPYIQKRKQYAVAPTKVEEDPIVPPTIEIPTTSSSPPTATDTAVVTNGSTDGTKVHEASAELASASPTTPNMENEVESGIRRGQEEPVSVPAEGRLFSDTILPDVNMSLKYDFL